MDLQWCEACGVRRVPHSSAVHHTAPAIHAGPCREERYPTTRVRGEEICRLHQEGDPSTDRGRESRCCSGVDLWGGGALAGEGTPRVLNQYQKLGAGGERGAWGLKSSCTQLGPASVRLASYLVQVPGPVIVRGMDPFLDPTPPVHEHAAGPAV